MNFNVYLNKDLGAKVKELTKRLHRSRNSIISEALEEWLENHDSSEWPKDFFDFKAIKEVPNFKQLRQEFSYDSNEDPLE